ncbi:DoxX family protein [Nocardioides sp.]|uniref:DoxX family protein n=1 Tax=Nocardioides sp. TaxID=35761 RepID=UPI0027335DFA|nr:DoxX family protein [Nocardioides sp.]MDP3892324.1 DoxX family protein [Nocardioides sp.]
MEGADLGLLVLRVAVGVVMVAHGYNHIFGGGRIAGTAGWFESLGMRPGRLHAWTASLTELGAGVLLLLGLLTPLAGGAVIGVMLVAWITNHRTNGFFVFRPGEGYEYVMMLTASGAALAFLGGGGVSLDHAMGWFVPPTWTEGLVAAGMGVLGAVALLAVCWRPPAPDTRREPIVPASKGVS